MNTPDPDTTVTPPPAANNDSDLATLLAEPASPRWYRRPALWAAALALTLAALGLWWWLAQRTANAAPSYSTQTVARGNLTLTVTANGTLQPTRSTSIGSELSGTVLKVNVDVNDRIRKGQVLVELDTAKLRDQILRSRAVLSAATAKVAQTVATVKEARAGLARLDEVARISAGQLPAGTELDTAHAALERALADAASARAGVNDAQAALALDEINLSKASIRAPSDGVVLTRTVDPGNAVAASLQAVTLFTVAEDLLRLRLWVYVDEADVGSVAKGQPGTHHPRRFRFDHHRQCGHLSHLSRRGQQRPQSASGHDGDGDHHRDAAQRCAAGAQQRAALHADRGRRRQGGNHRRHRRQSDPRPAAHQQPQVGRGRRQHRGGAPGVGAARRDAGTPGRYARDQRRPHDRNHRRRAGNRHAGDHRPEKGDRQMNAPLSGSMLASAAPPLAVGTPLIRLRAVAKVYGSGAAELMALKGIDLDISAGEFVAIMGPSGSGKSTAMNILGCLDTPSSGQYLFHGAHVEALSRDQRARLRRRYLGFVFQGFNLLARTSAQENVELPLLYRGETALVRHAAAARALQLVGLGGWEQHTPAELSGGQQQRVAIARAIVSEPAVLLADEPTGNLDTQRSQEIMELLRGLNAQHGITVLMVTHEPDMAAYARRLVRFVDGHIASDAANPHPLEAAPAAAETP
jgi:putative ABC transport system ATP-binding protein